MARKASEIPTRTPEGYRSRLLALQLLIMLAKKDGDAAKADALCGEFFGVLHSLVMEPDERLRSRAAQVLGVIYLNEWTVFSEDSLRNALHQLPEHAGEVRRLLDGLLGIAIARNGNWQSGLRHLEAAGNRQHTSIMLWSAKMLLARLLNETDRQRSLAVEGLARYAAGADVNLSGQLAYCVAHLAGDPQFASTVAGLVERARQMEGWVSQNFAALAAVILYYQGDFKGAAAQLDQAEQDNPQFEKLANSQHRAWGLFARAAIQAQLGNVEEAKRAYTQGLQLHPPTMSGPGRPLEGVFWMLACDTELLRREAAEALEPRVTPE